MKRRRLVVEIALAVVFLAACFYYIYKTDLRVDTRLSLCIKAQQEDIIRLFIPGMKPIKAQIDEDFQWVDFNLPGNFETGKGGQTLRLKLGQKPGAAVIRGVKIKSLLNTYRWSGKQIAEFFRLADRQGAKKNSGKTWTGHKNKDFLWNFDSKNNHLYIHSPGGEPLLPITGEIHQANLKLANEKLFFYLLSLGLSLVFFYFVHFITLRNLRIFFTHKIILDMVFLFVIIIFFPTLDDVFHITKTPRLHRLQEQKSLAPKPAFRFDAVFDYLKRWRAYYEDYFRPRHQLIYLNNYLYAKYFGISPLPIVLIGKQGWLFMGKQNERVDEIRYYRSLEPFSPEELEHWRLALEKRRDWLAARGIRYLFVIAPNKSTIYPEFLPGHIRPARPQSRLDRLVDYLQKHSDCSILDLRGAMLAAKKERLIYRKTDSHWNKYGAYLAYREIMKTLAKYFPEAAPLDISNFKIYINDRNGGDLAIMLFLHTNIFREKVIEMKSRFPLQAKSGELIKGKFPGVKQSVHENPGAKLGTVLVVHDSFAARLKSFLSEHFKRTIYLRDWNLGFYTNLIKKEKPVVVIEEMAERFLLSAELTFPPAR